MDCVIINLLLLLKSAPVTGDLLVEDLLGCVYMHLQHLFKKKKKERMN